VPLYLIQAAYTPEAWAALARSPENRAEPASALAKKLGGKLVDLYYCFGEYDAVVLVDLPDDAMATAFVIAAGSAGHIKATRTTRLMGVTETVEAMQKAGEVTYAPPKGMSERSRA
jgi:uncharacterized protein with GYD domain